MLHNCVENFTVTWRQFIFLFFYQKIHLSKITQISSETVDYLFDLAFQLRLKLLKPVSKNYFYICQCFKHLSSNTYENFAHLESKLGVLIHKGFLYIYSFPKNSPLELAWTRRIIPGFLRVSWSTVRILKNSLYKLQEMFEVLSCLVH